MKSPLPAANPPLGAIGRACALAGILFLLWLLLSGKWVGLLLGLGLVSVAGIAAFTWRLGLLDRESLPLHLLHPLRGIWLYWPWLAGETIKANLAVAKIILARDCSTQQRLFWIPSGQNSDMARAIYANSITLTPGTITVDMAGDRLLIHALNEEMCDSLGEMAQRIRTVDDNCAAGGKRAAGGKA